MQFPPERHGHAGKTSHAAKGKTKMDFLNFIDLNSQPNVRSADSTSATHFFLPKFRTIQTPKTGVSNFQERLKRSLVGEFNHTRVNYKSQLYHFFCINLALKGET